MGWYYKCNEDGLNWLTPRVHKPWLKWAYDHHEQWYKDRQMGRLRRTQLAVCVPRSFGKSNILTKPLPIFTMLRERNMAAVIGSETHPKAKEFLAPLKSIIDGSDPYSLFTWLYGNWFDKDRTWNEVSIVTAFRNSLGVSEPSIQTFGVETGLTGKHPLMGTMDDPITQEKLVDGGSWNTRANNSLDAIYPALRPDSFFMLIMTRYLDNDPMGTQLAQSGVATWTGHPPIKGERVKYNKEGYHVFFLQARDTRNTTNYAKGEPVLPESGWDDAQLNKDERERPQWHATQMMNDPSKGEHMELTDEQCDKMKIKREDLPAIEYASIHVDTAFKDEKTREKGDYSTIVVFLHQLRTTGIVYLDRVLRSNRWRSEEFDSQLIRVLHDLDHRGIRIRVITVEKEMGGLRDVYRKHLITEIQKGGLRAPDILMVSRAGKNKVIRIREASDYWLGGFVRILDDCDGAGHMIYEMTHINRSANDDVSDAGADVFLPDVWRGRPSNAHDPQPHLPVQPGDDVLKQRFQREMQHLEDQVLGRDPVVEDYQPMQAEFEDPDFQETDEAFNQIFSDDW